MAFEPTLATCSERVHDLRQIAGVGFVFESETTEFIHIVNFTVHNME